MEVDTILSNDEKDTFLSVFIEVDNFFTDNNNEKQIKAFMPIIDAKNFNNNRVIEVLLETLPWFCLSRKYLDKNKRMNISKTARNKFRNYTNNKWELWELLLFAFLESDFWAPRILSKMEIKTAPNDYVKWSDGIHFKKIWDIYFLIYWESKMYKNLDAAIKEALSSINDFKLWIRRDKNKKELERDPCKYWINFDKVLISSNLDKEFSEEDRIFLESVIFPSRDTPSSQTAFAIFIGYEINLIDLMHMPHAKFSDSLKEQIKNEISSKKQIIIDNIKEHNLDWHNFNFYFLPFSNIDEDRKEIIKELTS